MFQLDIYLYSVPPWHQQKFQRVSASLMKRTKPRICGVFLCLPLLGHLSGSQNVVYVLVYEHGFHTKDGPRPCLSMQSLLRSWKSGMLERSERFPRPRWQGALPANQPGWIKDVGSPLSTSRVAKQPPRPALTGGRPSRECSCVATKKPGVNRAPCAQSERALQITLTCEACRPFWPCVTLKDTF